MMFICITFKNIVLYEAYNRIQTQWDVETTLQRESQAKDKRPKTVKINS